jgi:hypothetical protein
MLGMARVRYPCIIVREAGWRLKSILKGNEDMNFHTVVTFVAMTT